MRNSGYFKNKKVAIVGLARSGLACANLLFDLGADVSITDNQDNPAIGLKRAALKSEKIKIELGRHSEDFIRGKDLVVVSPGVEALAPPLVWARKLNIPVISEIEVGWILCPGTIIAVSGSSGKTTVTTLIARVIAESCKKVFTCGNIGNPFCAEVAKMREGDFVSLEVSSFQLEAIKNFKPHIAVILNIGRNHLDRYKNMRQYCDAKKRLFMNQSPSDYLILNKSDPILNDFAKQASSQVRLFSGTNELNLNQAAVLAVASILGIAQETCLKVFREFKGIEHRMEQAAVINGIKFINDSKSTTVESAIWALDNIKAPVILICGGKDKGADYSLILGPAKGKVKHLILIGQARQKIRQALAGALAAQDAATLEEAVDKAFALAKSGDCLLFSPMCSSFDMFANYEERGRVFKEIVSGLSK